MHTANCLVSTLLGEIQVLSGKDKAADVCEVPVCCSSSCRNAPTTGCLAWCFGLHLGGFASEGRRTTHPHASTTRHASI